jgi:EAL domain-containing protein (putative c-di-GMP-specific phosphodiesterase class I)
MVQEIRLMLAREAVPKGTLKLEITESLVMENPERAVEILTWLKTYGASLALDDFGTGYCSLSYLHRFPCDTIKVDRSLVRDSGLNGSTPLILRSIIALAHELGKEVVAEGVETAADASYLRSIGCEYGQGYYYGEPMSPKDVKALLTALASHRKRKMRERARAAPAEPQAPGGLEVQVGGASPLPALTGPRTVASS